MFKDAARAVTLLAAAMEHAEFDVPRLAARAEQGWITVTELADTLARDHRLPFKAGHAIASRLIARARTAPERPLSEALREVSKEVTGTEIVYDEAALTEILSPEHFVDGAEDAWRSGAIGDAARDWYVGEGAWRRRVVAARDAGRVASGGGAVETGERGALNGFRLQAAQAPGARRIGRPEARSPKPEARQSVITQCLPISSGSSVSRRSISPGPNLSRK